MAINGKIKQLYDAIKSDGGDVGTEEEFNDWFLRPGEEGYNNRKRVYDTFKSDGADVGANYEEFRDWLGLRPADAGAAASTAAPSAPMQQPSASVEAEVDEDWQPTSDQKAVMSNIVQSSLAGFNRRQDEAMERLGNTADYYNRGGGVLNGRKPIAGDVRYNPYKGEVEQTYITPNGTVTADKREAERETRAYNDYVDNTTIAGQLRRAGRDLTELHRKREMRVKAIHEKWKESQEKNNAPLAVLLGSNTYSPTIESDPEYRALTAAIHSAEERVRTLQHESDRQGGKDVGFWRGFGEVVSDLKTWDFGYSDFMDAMTRLDADDDTNPHRIAKSDDVKRSEQIMMEQIREADDAAAKYGENESFFYRAGVMSAEMLPFMLDFAVMGGSSSGTSLLTRNIGAVLLKGLHKAAPKVARKKAVQWTTKVVGAMPEDLLYRAPLMTNSVQSMKTSADIIDRKLGNVVEGDDGNYVFSNDKTWGSAVWQGEANAIIENYSEMFGTHLEGVLSLGTMAKVADIFGAKRMSALLTKASSGELSGIAATVKKHFSQLGVSDYVGEVGEEYYGQLWRTMLNVDDAYKHNPDGSRTNLFLDGQFHGDIWGGMALSMGLMGLGRHSITAASYVEMKYRVNKADKRASGVFDADAWEGLRERIDGTTNNDIGELADKVIFDDSLSDEQKDAVMGYMEASMNLRGFNLASIARQRGMEMSAEEALANEGYIDGYSATTPQEMVDARLEMERQRMKLVSSMSEDVADEFDADPLDALARTYDPEIREIASKYVNARMVYDGMIQRVRDDIDGRIAQSDAMIDGRVNRDTGMIQGATLTDGKEVYVVNGSVAMLDDGINVDIENSDESLIVRDAEGRLEFVAPSQVQSLLAPVDAASEKEAAAEAIRNEIAQSAADKIDGVLHFAPNDVYAVINEDGSSESLTIVGESVDASGVAVDGMVDVMREDGSVVAMNTADIQRMVDESNARRLEERDKARESAEADKGVEADGGGLQGDAAADAERSTALSRIPVDESGEPLYEQVDADTAWDAFVEQSEGDEEIAREVVADIVAEKRKELADAEKALKSIGESKPNASNGEGALTVQERIVAKMALKRALTDARDAVERAKGVVDHWQSIGDTVRRRAEAEAAERRRQAEIAAEEARQAAERERIEAEEAERLKREALNGVPDWGYDTAADARARGYRRAGTDKVDRQRPIASVMGKEIDVKFSDRDIVKGRVAIIDAGELQPSHIQGERNPVHFLDEAQPKERNDAASVVSAQKIASNIRPEEITSSVTAYTGAPTVNSRGEVIQGNSRSDALRLMYESQRESAERYKQYLVDHAADFGLTPEQIVSMDSPVLVNVVDVDDHEAIRLGQFVAQDTESGGVERIKTKNAVQKMGDKIRNFANILLSSTDDEATFAQLVDANGVEVLKWMNQHGFITDTQYASAFDSRGNLTGEAVNDLKGIMYQSIFTGGSTRLEEMFNKMPAKAQRAILATAFRDYDSALDERMIGEIQQSIIAFDALTGYEQFRDATNAEATQLAVEAWKRQYAFDDVSGESYLPSETFSNFALALAAMYKGHTQKHIQGVFNAMYDIIQGTEQDNLFESADKTPKPLADAIRRVLNIDYQPIVKTITDNGTNGDTVLDINSEDGQDGRPGSDADASGAEQDTRVAEPADGGGGTLLSFAERGRQGDIQNTQRRQQDYIPQTEEITANLSEEETDEYGKPLVLAKDGTTVLSEVSDGKGNALSTHNQIIVDESPYKQEDNAESLNHGLDDLDDSALAERIVVSDDDWTEGDGETPTYKRTINIDGKHTVVQVDEPDGNGFYTGSYFDYQGTRFGGIAEVIEHIDKHVKLASDIAAAEAEVNTSPTDKQKEAGNYKKGHVRVGAFDVTIENPKGSVRRGTDATGKKWEQTMSHTYGYIKGTEGVDGDHIDVFLSSDIDGWDGRRVYVVDQYNPDGTFDEHKVMLGFNSEDDAYNAYLSNYESGWEKGRRLDVGAVDIREFEKWIDSSHRKTKAFSEYRSVKSDRRGMDEREISSLLNKMKSQAVTIPYVEITEESWKQYFETPIGNVKMGENQKEKLFNKDRTNQYGMLAETLSNPDIILEESDQQENIFHERPSSYLFIKTFKKRDGSKYVHFENVTVSQGGLEVSISSHIIRENQLKNKMKSDRLLYKATALDEPVNSSAEQPINKGDSLSSTGKDNALSSEKQANNKKSSDWNGVEHKRNGSKRGKNDSQLSDEAPLSLDDMRSAVKPTFEETPAESKPKNPSGNKLVTDEQYAELLAKMRKKMGGQLNMGVDPEILAIGSMMAVYHIEKGARKFTEYVKAMVADLGEKFPARYLKGFYKAAHEMIEDAAPEIAAEMDADGIVNSADIASIINERVDAMTTAAMVVAEEAAEVEREYAERKLKEERKAEHTKAIMSKIGISTDTTEVAEPGQNTAGATDSDAKFSVGSEVKGDADAYNATKGLVESTGIEVVEVSGEEAQAMMEQKNTPFAGLPNRANEKQSSGSVFLSINGNSSSNRADSKEYEAKLQNKTLSAKTKIAKFKNGDYLVNTGSLSDTIKDLGKLLAMDTKGGSRYTILRTDKGDTVAIRLSDHRANGNNFGRDAAERNLSIVIERKRYDVPDSGIEFTEVVIPQSVFESRPEEVVSAIVNGVEAVLADKPFTLDSSIGTVEEIGQNVGHAHLLHTPSGVVYGWTVGGKVYLNRDAMNPEAPIHEYTHLWDEMVRRENPHLWERGKDLMKQMPLWNEIVADSNYADIRDDEDAVASEVHARLTGRAGARLLSGMIDTAKGKGAMATAEAVSVVDSLKRWLTEMLDALKATLGKWSKRNLDELTIEDFNNLTLRDIAEGVNPQEGELSDARFHAAMSRGREDFDAVRERAIAERGIVTPGLNRKEIRVVDVPRHDFTGTGKQAIEKARLWADSNLIGNHHYHSGQHDGFTYVIDKTTLEKYLSSSSTKGSDNLGVHLAALKMLPEIINENIEAEIHVDYVKGNGKRSASNGIGNPDILIHRMFGAITIDGALYRVKTTIKEDRNERVTPYNYQVTELELLISGSETSDALSNSNSISAANLLQGVEKSYDPGKKLLEESRLSDVSEAEDVRYRSAGKNNTEDVNHQFNLDLNRYKNHELASGFRFNLGKPSKELISAGFPDLPISMRASLLSRKSGMERHPFNAEKLRDLVKSIQRPIAIFHYTKSNIRNLIVDAEYEGKHFLMGITLNYNTDGLEINSVSGIFPKESHEWIKWIQDGKAIRIDEKEKVLSIIDSLRTNPAESERIGLNLDTVANIVKTFENPIAEDVRYRSADVANRIERLFDDAVAGNLKGKSIEIGRLTEEGKKYLEDLSGIEMKEIVSLVLNPSDLVHVYRNHFNGNEKDLGNNIPLLKEDIRAIANVLAKPERVLYGEEPDGLRRKMFYFLSSAQDLGAYNLLEIHGDRKGNLTAKTFYKTKKAVSQRVLSLMKSEHLTSVTDGASLSDANLPNFFELPTDDGYENLERSGDGSYSDAEVSMENDPWSKAWGETLRSKREQRAFAKRERERMRAKAVELSERLGVDIEIIEDNSSLEGKRGRSKGWYSVKDGRISVVIGNHVSVADIEKTVLHEAVAHHGLRELLGEHFDEFLDKVYDWADNSIKERIALLASRNGWNRRVATEEYLAGLAEDTDFENAKAYNGWWGKIKRLFLDMLSAVGFKRTGVELSDNELRYILWRSYKNMVEPGRFRAFEWEAEDVAMKYNLKAGEYAESSPVTEQRVAEAGELYELNDRFNNELNRQIAGDLPQGHVYDMGMPSEYLLSTGIARLPIRLSAKILNVKSNLERHAYDLETLRNLVYAIQKPWAIFSYGDRSKAQNMIIGIEDNGRQFLVGISINPTIKGRVLEINSIRNVFPKNNHEWVNWINEGKLLRVDGKKEIQDIIAKLRMNPVAFDYVDLDNAAKIVENFKNPTIREQNNNAGESSDDGVRYRMGDFTPRDRKIAADVYDKMVSSARFEFSEAMQDSMLGLKKLYEAIKGKKGFRIEEVEGYENAYTYENRMSSTNGNEQHLYFIRKMKPLLKAISDICGNSDSERRILTDYMIAKHGLERNVILAERDAREAASKGADYNDELAKCRQRDYSGLTALTGEKDLATAERVAQQMVDDYERDTDTTELWSRVKSATEATLEKMYTSGLMSEDRFNQVRGMFQHYIPLRGWDETTSNEVYTYLLQDDHATGTSLTKKAGGRSSKADDPIANIAAMADSAISQGNRNIMKQRFLNFVLNNPSDLVSHNELWLEHDAVNDEWRPVFAELDAADTPADVAKKIEAFEARMESLQAQHPDKYKRGSEAVNIPYKVVGNNLREHQVLVRRNGVTTVLTINGNPRAAQALNGLTNPDVKAGSHYDEALSVVMYVNRQLSALYTTRNPDFVVSNFMRDMLYSNCMTWVKETPSYALRYHRNFGKFNPAVMAKLLNKYENGTLNSNDYIEHAFEQFMANGGETGFTNLKDIEGHKRAIAKELRRQGNVALRGWSALGMKLDLMNRSVENCARFAAYVTSREMGRSVDRSVYDAKEISVNFNKKGSGGTMAQKNRTLLGKIGAHTSGWGRLLYVFWNAGIQGMTNYGRAAKRNPAKATAAATALFSLGWVIPLLAQAGGGDDDDKNAYYNLPSYIRRSNICFRAGEQWVTIPLPIEYRAIYGLGELAYGAISGNERYSDDELCLEVMAQFSQLLPIDMLEGGGGLSPFIPSAAKPAVEAYVMNKSWTGLPIYKDTGYNKDDPEWTKAYKNADQHLVKASRWLNEVSGGDDFKKGSWWGDVNPAKLEYFLNGMFGGMVSFPSKVVKTVETIGGSREFEWRNIPLANRVIRSGDERTANRRLKSDYYKYKKEAMDAKRLARKYESRGQEGFMEYAEKADFLYNSPEYRRALVFTDYEPDIKALEQSIDDAGDPNVRKMLETDLYSTMREMVNELDGIAQE